MQYTIENISEDSFYVNLLLGLPRLLNKLKRYGLKGHYIRRFPQLTESAVQTWEGRSGVVLPVDLRKFYLSTDGFLFEWNLNFGHGDYDVIAGISINALEDFVQLECVRHAEVTKNGAVVKPTLGHDVKIFALAKVGNLAQVVAVFARFKFGNNIWLRTNDGRFHYLSSDLTTYLRMCVAHLGIPYWQMVYAGLEVPQWVECLMAMLLPQLKETRAGEKRAEFTNKLNANVFREDYVHAERKPTNQRKKAEDKKPVQKLKKFTR